VLHDLFLDLGVITELDVFFHSLENAREFREHFTHQELL